MIPKELESLVDKGAVTIPVCACKLTLGVKKEGGVFGWLEVMVHKSLRESPGVGRIFVEKMREFLDRFEKGLEAPND